MEERFLKAVSPLIKEGNFELIQERLHQMIGHHKDQQYNAPNYFQSRSAGLTISESEFCLSLYELTSKLGLEAVISKLESFDSPKYQLKAKRKRRKNREEKDIKKKSKLN